MLVTNYAIAEMIRGTGFANNVEIDHGRWAPDKSQDLFEFPDERLKIRYFGEYVI